MASHPLNYDPYPEVQPTGGPEAREQIHTDPDMFGAAIGRGMGQLGQGLEHTSQEGLDVATQQARMDAQTHANELHSWQSDQVTDAQEKFLTIRGKNAELALPQFKAQIDDLHQQARSQAGNPYTAQLIDTEGRRLTDMAYSQASRHAAQQKSVWDTETATDSAASSGSRAALGAQTTPANVAINANPSVVLGLSRSDDFARQGAQLKGLDGDIEVQKNRGRNVAEIIKSATADGSQTSLQRAIDFFHTQYDRMDPGSRATIEQTLKSQAASYDGQKTADIYMGRGPFLPPGYAQAATNIESGGNPNAATSSGTYKGLGQFSPALEARYGLNESNRGDPASVARAYSQENAENHDALARALGHEPTPADYYLAHQQGVGGAVAHIMQPNLPAWQNMQHTIEGQEKGAGWAKQAIWGNMTPPMKAQFPGGVETVTSGDFAAMWAQRFYGQPIQASGALPGNGTQQPGMQPATMFGGGFNRLNMASDFSETNKGDVIKRITNDPYLLDHPQAMNAAITYTNKIFEAQTASYSDMHRALQIQEAQKKMASESAENDYLKQIYAPVANAKPLSVQGIVLDDRLSRESKDRLIDRIAKAGGNPDSYGPGFDNLFHKIHAPEGSSERITDVSQLYDHVGKDISYPAFEKLRDEINLKKTPEGNSESEMKAQFLKDARGKITGTDEGLHIKDPKGDDLYLKFLAQVLPAYDEGRRGTKDKPGKSPSQLLNPDSPDYVGKIITNFKRPMEQWFSDTVHDASGTPATAAKPAFDISTVKSLDDLVGAYRSGKVTKDQADQMAISNGWATREPRPPRSQ